MARYTVEVKEIHNNIIEGIEADNLEDALEEAERVLAEDDLSSLVSEYSYTLSPDMWTVRNEDTGVSLQ